ncbi:LOW QUALITY PROTEIN: protein GVQW3-like [Halictus rubicundus]|uniref:LOW QUALITY PROTEIN: protein GVQW3-like n=1 Tax=Halictus rubicundus TaxID=77578 RepID=UPI0040367AD1
MTTSVFTAVIYTSRSRVCSAIFTMERTVEQRICLKFCVSNEISCAEALKMLQKAYGKSCLSKTQTYEWYKAFKEGREEVQDLPRAGRPSMASTDENIEKIKKMVIDNRRLSVREVAHEVEMSHMSVHNILTEVLGMRRVAARLVPKELNFLQKEHRKAYSPDMAPCDFFLFPKLKLPLWGRRFESIEAIKENSHKELKAPPSSAFKKCFEDWEKRWRMCIASDGAYFEGDKINLDD